MKFSEYHLITIILTALIIFYPVFDSLYGDKINLTLKGKVLNEITGNLTDDYDFFFLPPLENKGFFESIDDLSICRNNHVRKFISLYLTDGRDYLTGAIARSNMYYDQIADIFDANSDMPKDIALLPLLESAFNPYAVSRSNAVGIWQFMQNTSKALDLKVNSYVDERRDIQKSTTAAIRHLRTLYNIFGSWELALASYNGGASYIKKAMIKSHSSTLRQLVDRGALNRETGEYLYRYAAMLIIYKNQSMFDIKTELRKQGYPATGTIVLDYPVKIQNISELTGVSVQMLRNLNPELKQDITPPYEKKYQFIIPEEYKGTVEKNLTQLYAVRYRKLKKHIVKKGECMSRIAAKYKSDVKKIVLLNNLESSMSIRPGQELFIPI